MTVLEIHGLYQRPGGEDQSVAAEVAVLEEHGHTVIRYSPHNATMTTMGRIEAAVRTIWNQASLREIRDLVGRHRPDVVHVHNTFPLVSPAAYYALRPAGVVQTLHNFRLQCLNALLLRHGKVCEQCVGKRVPWPGVVHKCYRGSWGASAATAAMLTIHRALGTWRNAVDLYLTPSEFARRKLVEGGLPAEKVYVQPNIVHPDTGVGEGGGGYGLFVGRLSHEKGLATLVKAWEGLGVRMPLRIVGDGPLAPLVASAAARNTAIQWLGPQPREAVYSQVGAAEFLVCPSECHETFGRVIVEAFAKGTPVVASRMGAIPELVEEGRTGLLFQPGDVGDLASKVTSLMDNESLRLRMRGHARAEFEAKYAAEHSYRLLLEAYRKAINCRGGEGRLRSGTVQAQNFHP